MKASGKTWTQCLFVMGMMTALGANAEPTEDPPPENGAQGTRLHGSERFENVNIPLGSIEPSAPPAGMECGAASAQMIGGRLVGTQVCTSGNAQVTRHLEGSSLAGASFRAPFEGRSVKLTIEGLRCHNNILSSKLPCTALDASLGKALWEYRITASTEDNQPQLLCPHGSGFALAVPYAWSTGGNLLPNPEYFTFACAPENENKSGPLAEAFYVGGGVIAKCIDWGFPPWPVAPRTQDNALKYHQLCTRMATADYCGEGHSNTLDGTPLEFMTAATAVRLGEDGLPSTLDGYSLEAVWMMDDCGGVRPLCLGKKRWNTLPLEATCVGGKRVLAPRDALACDSLNLPAQTDATLLVSYSLFIDRSLVQFKDAGKGYVTTTSVTVDPELVEGSSVNGISLDLDADGVADATPFTALRKEGPILSPKLPANILKRMREFIKPLYQCVDGYGHYLLTDSESCDGIAGYSLNTANDGRGIEGYIYSAVDSTSASQRRPLKLWQHRELGVFATSTQAPPGFTFERDLGYLPAVGQLPGRDL
ncbi:ADYC domain-containing protein [Corallococcus sp. EGB]|uniref:ADYC domain-containing protein n=1 Tax=Corallococcus sp. EGB TaxID=1521117 RepID=UPI001CBEB489|nr:ADYC domain-containing protein [Corallococcus sp. EGB]